MVRCVRYSQRMREGGLARGLQNSLPGWPIAFLFCEIIDRRNPSSPAQVGTASYMAPELVPVQLGGTYTGAPYDGKVRPGSPLSLGPQRTCPHMRVCPRVALRLGCLCIEQAPCSRLPRAQRSFCFVPLRPAESGLLGLWGFPIRNAFLRLSVRCGAGYFRPRRCRLGWPPHPLCPRRVLTFPPVSNAEQAPTQTRTYRIGSSRRNTRFRARPSSRTTARLVVAHPSARLCSSVRCLAGSPGLASSVFHRTCSQRFS